MQLRPTQYVIVKFISNNYYFVYKIISKKNGAFVFNLVYKTLISFILKILKPSIANMYKLRNNPVKLVEESTNRNSINHYNLFVSGGSTCAPFAPSDALTKPSACHTKELKRIRLPSVSISVCEGQNIVVVLFTTTLGNGYLDCCIESEVDNRS